MMESDAWYRLLSSRYRPRDKEGTSIIPNRTFSFPFYNILSSSITGRKVLIPNEIKFSLFRGFRWTQSRTYRAADNLVLRGRDIFLRYPDRLNKEISISNRACESILNFSLPFPPLSDIINANFLWSNCIISSRYSSKPCDILMRKGGKQTPGCL